jgi:hypothetical protein
MSEKAANTGAGKGDNPRNCFSKKFKDNYDLIMDWVYESWTGEIFNKDNTLFVHIKTDKDLWLYLETTEL